MAETLTFLLRAAALPTEAIAPAVRLAAALSVGVAMPEDRARQAAQVRDAVWDRIRPHLGELFEFSGGRVRLKEAEDLDGFDLLALKLAASEKRKRPSKPSNDPRVHALVALGMEDDEAKKFVSYGVRTYGEAAFESGLEVAKQRNPEEPRGFIIRVIQNRMSPGGGTGVPGIEPKRIARHVRVVNPEAARSVQLGWEAPSFDTLGVPSYPTGKRRQVWRTRTGAIQYMEAGPGTKIPTPLEDAGVQIVENQR